MSHDHHGNRNADPKGKVNSNNNPRTIRAALADLLASYAEYYRAKAKQTQNPQSAPEGCAAWITAWGTWAAVVVAGVAAVVFLMQLQEMVTATRISVRPWVGISDDGDGLQTGPLIIGKTGVAVPYILVTKNYTANGFVQNVMGIADLVVSENLAQVARERDELCGVNFVGHRAMGFALFSGKTKQVTSSMARADRSDITHPGWNGKFEAWIVGCIGYRDQFGYPYRTKFIYWFTKPDYPHQPVEFSLTDTNVAGQFVEWQTAFDDGRAYGDSQDSKQQ